ncbi:MAG: PglZ domain protein [Deltaproteobacteria bacterium ADurb.Bin135]|nr:MAG: PglZ domain protein [Deltaproteobacteria bacterium ADurb.Bin135]
MATKAHTFLDILSNRLGKAVDSARLILVLDPKGLVDAPNPLLDAVGRDWQVLVYDKNDLILRRILLDIQANNGRIVIVARGAVDSNSKSVVDLSYVPDLVEDAVDVIDCSPAGLLAEMVKDRLPPDLFDEPLLSLWSEKIDKLVGNLSKFRKLAVTSATMNRFDAMAVTLATSCPKISVEDLASLPTDHIERIISYIKAVILCELTEQEMAVLRAMILGSEPHLQLRSWCSLERTSLVRCLYFGTITARYAVPRGIFDLEKLSLLDFDVYSLGESIGAVLAEVKSDLSLQMSVCAEAEKEPDLVEALSKIEKTITFASFDEMFEMVMAEPYPALVFVLGRRALVQFLGSSEGKAALIRGSDDGSRGEVYQKSPFALKASQMLDLIGYFAWFVRTLSKPLKTTEGFFKLIEAYHNHGFHLLELTLAEINETIRLLKDESLSEALKPFLEQIEHQVVSVIDAFDQALAKNITADLSSYTHFSHLNTQTLRNLIQTGIHHEERVWIIVLDGLRLDSWDRVVWPQLSEFFDVEGEEQLYLSTLPSYTDISRVAFFAGKLPAFWKDYYNNPTTDHNILLSRHLGLGKDESKKLLKVLARGEEKAEQGELDFENSQYRVLIFNVSDDWIHHEQGSLVRINEIIRERFEKIILPELRSGIGPKDTVVITSDHGFIELRKGNAHSVDLKALGDIDPADITYRYIRNKKYAVGAQITYDNKDIWTVAISRDWFERPKAGGKKARYSHGGISMAEMVVPAVRLKKKTVLKAEIVIVVEAPPEAVPGDTIVIPVKIANKGTVETDVNLACRLSGRLISETKVKLLGGTSYTWKVSVKVDPKARQFAVAAQYVTPQKEKKTEKRQIEIPIKEVGMKVDIDTSALDAFEDL